MDQTTILRDRRLNAKGVVDALWQEMLTDAHALVFCASLDQDADPGEAAEQADRQLLDLYAENLDIEEPTD